MFDSDPTIGFRTMLTIILVVAVILTIAFGVTITNRSDAVTTTSETTSEETANYIDWLIYQNMLNTNNSLLH